MLCYRNIYLREVGCHMQKSNKRFIVFLLSLKKTMLAVWLGHSIFSNLDQYLVCINPCEHKVTPYTVLSKVINVCTKSKEYDIH